MALWFFHDCSTMWHDLVRLHCDCIAIPVRFTITDITTAYDSARFTKNTQQLMTMPVRLIPKLLWSNYVFQRTEINQINRDFCITLADVSLHLSLAREAHSSLYYNMPPHPPPPPQAPPKTSKKKDASKASSTAWSSPEHLIWSHTLLSHCSAT